MAEQNNDDERPNLEQIAKNMANMEEDHKIDQIMPSILDAFHSVEGVKFTDDKGVIHYKTKFTEKEADKIADTVYDSLVYHMRRTYDGLDEGKFKDLKGIKDRHGNSMLDNHVKVYFDISRHDLKRALTANRNKLNHNTLMQVLEPSIQHNTNYHFSHITQDLKPKHVDHIKDFIKHNVKDHKLPGDEYDTSDATTLQEVLRPMQKVAGQHYKDYKAPAK